ncbi:MAG: hypothetical protein R3245_01440 [Kiloniellales bacterium]|nr:hypothetical protein [Kiloniellales bacterium]
MPIKKRINTEIGRVLEETPQAQDEEPEEATRDAKEGTFDRFYRQRQGIRKDLPPVKVIEPSPTKKPKTRSWPKTAVMMAGVFIELAPLAPMQRLKI